MSVEEGILLKKEEKAQANSAQYAFELLPIMESEESYWNTTSKSSIQHEATSTHLQIQSCQLLQL